MISYQIIKKSELKIDTYSSSLIVSTIEPFIRLLEIIKNLLIKIKEMTISLDIKIIDITFYFLLLGNNWF